MPFYVTQSGSSYRLYEPDGAYRKIFVQNMFCAKIYGLRFKSRLFYIEIYVKKHNAPLALSKPYKLSADGMSFIRNRTHLAVK